MLEILKKLAGTSRPATSSELREALASIDEAALSAAVQTAQEECTKALLAGEEKRLERAEAALATARRDLDRGRAATETLTTKIAETEAAEAKAALDAERAELDKLATSTASDLRLIYERASAEIIAVLDRVEDVEAKIKGFNDRIYRRALDRGSSRIEEPHMKDVESRAFPIHHGILSALRLTSLRPLGRAPGYGDGREVFRVSGEKV